jgi:hypothetical protein
MTITFKKLRPRSRATRQAIAETEVARLLLLSLPPGYRMSPTNGQR